MEKETQFDSEISIKEKSKALSPKEKYSYIWEYYKIHIIITLLSIVGLASFSHTMMTKKSTYCTITYYNSYIDENQLYSLRDTLNDLLIENPEKSTILINPIWSDSNTVYRLTPTEEIAIKIAAKEIDLAIINEEYFNAQVSQDMFENISTIDGFENLNIPEELLVKASDSNDTEGIYGIKIDSLNLLKEIDFPSKDNILTIIVNSERKEHALHVLNVLTK